MDGTTLCVLSMCSVQHVMYFCLILFPTEVRAFLLSRGP